MYKNKDEQLACQRRHYRNNKQYYRDRNDRHREELKKWYVELKSTLSCSVCSENHPACLHFHHKDPATKIDAVAHMVVVGSSKQKILAETAKCVVLCANCHAKIHFCSDVI